MIGSRKRAFISSVGERIVLIIRRLKCKACGRVHHELPDILVPYKRYSSESIEAVIGCKVEVVYDPADTSRLTIEYEGHPAWTAKRLTIRRKDRAAAKPAAASFAPTG